jgi:hypothetical protein
VPRAATRSAHAAVVQRTGDVLQAPDTGGLDLRTLLLVSRLLHLKITKETAETLLVGAVIFPAAEITNVPAAP